MRQLYLIIDNRVIIVTLLNNVQVTKKIITYLFKPALIL